MTREEGRPTPDASSKAGSKADRPSQGDRLLDVREAATCDIAGMLIVRLCPERQLGTLPLGTRVVLTSGKVATLVDCSFTRAVVRLHTGAQLDVAPGAELEVVEAVIETATAALLPGRRVEVIAPADVVDDVVSTVVRDEWEIAHGTTPAAAEMRQTAPARRLDPLTASDASGDGLEALGQGTRLCSCGVWFMPGRPWQRHCSRRCRQRAYDGRHRAEQHDGHLPRERRA